MRNVPIADRYLWFEGKISNESLKLVASGLPKDAWPNTEILFVGFSYTDLPVGTTFQVIYPKHQPEAGVLCESKILAVTQQFGTPLDHVPGGWKTISVVQFPTGVPDLIRNLPTVDTWYQNRESVCVCNQETWEAIKAR